MPVTMEEREYDALLTWARRGAGAEEAVTLEQLQRRVDGANGLQRHRLVVRYDVVPSTQASINAQGPAGYTVLLDRRAPITRDDVLTALQGKPTAPSLIHVTRDVEGVVGWYELDRFPF